MHKVNNYNTIPLEFIEWIDLIFSDRIVIIDEVHNLREKFKEEYEANNEILIDQDNIKNSFINNIKIYQAIEFIVSRINLKK